MIFITWLMLSTVPTDVPPNLRTFMNALNARFN
jgi:hypothetical protein